ncbi:hypothetical protein [Mycetocola spongiae]|uniref:hypothetical protein n=1 Tax=Mycetocola spongiae TaxID=2859226 RepID=UPI001CF49C4F|nr:hypothetical protein [Mycetocola spongiae]UCR90104.1 hypothetical protein KXZ72_05410 [Mycetocola spongiae]
MIAWFTILQICVATLAGVLCVVLGLIGRKPSDLTLGGAALVQLLIIVQLVVAIVAPATGNQNLGFVPEFYAYLISAVLLPALAVLWGLLDRSRWSTVIVGVACLAIAVMVYRMHYIWVTPVIG